MAHKHLRTSYRFRNTRWRQLWIHFGQECTHIITSSFRYGFGARLAHRFWAGFSDRFGGGFSDGFWTRLSDRLGARLTHGFRTWFPARVPPLRLRARVSALKRRCWEPLFRTRASPDLMDGVRDGGYHGNLFHFIPFYSVYLTANHHHTLFGVVHWYV